MAPKGSTTNQPHIVAFESFLSWATKNKPQNLNAGIGKQWTPWWDDGFAQSSEKHAINSILGNVEAQSEFIEGIKNRTAQPLSGRMQDLILCSLAHQSPFDKWTCFDTYRLLEHQSGTYAVTVDPGSVRKFFVALSTRHGLNDLDVETINFELSNDAPAQALESVYSLLTGRGYWRLMGRWMLLGRRTYVNRFYKYSTRFLMFTGALIVLCLILFISTADPSVYFKDDSTLLWAAFLLIAVSSAMVLSNAASVCFEIFFRARSQGKRWAALLKASKACVLTDQPRPPIEGTSCGVPLMICILLALDEADPVTELESPFWHQLVDQLKRSAATWAVSAEARPDGNLGNVELHDDKLKAVLDHNRTASEGKRVCRLIISDQDAVNRLTRKLSREKDVGQDATQTSMLETAMLETALNVIPMARQHAKAASGSKFQVRSCSTFAKLCLDFARPAAGRFLTLMSHASFGLLIAVSCIAIQQSCQIARPPRYELYSTPPVWQENAHGGNLQLTIHTDEPWRFATKFTSCYWASRPAEQFAPDPSMPSRWSVNIKLEKHNSSDPRCNFLDGSIEVQRLRSFFWRDLPPTRVSTEPLWVVAKDFRSQLQKIASEGEGAQPELSSPDDNQPQ